ncbi:hypothetical protein DV736_g5155, partial [Chaetothyriales sp. CBS 134916]
MRAETDGVFIHHQSTNYALVGFVVSAYIIIVPFIFFGPLSFAPLSELYGRNVIMHSSNVASLVFTLWCAVGVNIAMFVVFRLLQSFAGCLRAARAGRSPIFMFFALEVSIVYSFLYLLCLLFATFTFVFVEQYGFGEGAAGLAYLGLGVGFLLGFLGTGATSDLVAKKEEVGW